MTFIMTLEEKNELNRKKVSNIAFRVFCEIRGHIYGNNKATAWPTQKTIAENIGCSVRSVQKAIKELTEKGLIEKIRLGLRKANIYVITALRKVVKDFRTANEIKKDFLNNEQREVKKEVVATTTTTKKIETKKVNKNISINYSGQRQYDVQWLEQNLVGIGELSEYPKKGESSLE
ncbi:helix-turn-helix domain-containing protein [Thermobrachium celere]|uniref:helix-turn-helix domain-containing protein n=1 Tax=Thermobrachium celere TaxID=53422 RepID=UPI0019438514|nr:helix-turn-helix domain-containing protein [Thermobrachium celere]GFR35346.1 hypothetical protein TCEA9_11580 [Thermobrachium celere]